MNEQTKIIRRVVTLLRKHRVRFALIGGHAVSYYSRPRVTVDVDFLVSRKSVGVLETTLGRAGFQVEQRGEVVRLWAASADPKADEPIVDFVPAEYNATQLEAFKTAREIRYQGISLRMVTRPALVALKFLSAASEHRAAPDKAQDVADLGRLVKQAWTPEDAAEAGRLVDLSQPGASKDLAQLIDDLIHDRPITI